MSWIDIAVLGQKRGVVIVDQAPGWADFIDELHFADVFEGDEPEHLEPGVYRWSGFTIGSWDEGDPCVAKGGTFTRAAPPAMDREAVTKLAEQLSHEVEDWRHNAYTRVMLAQMRDRLSAILSTLSADAIRQGEGLDHKVAAFVAEYEFRGDDGDFKAIIEDAIHGFLAQHPATPAHASDGGEGE
jgi:hypothetical protein